MRKFVKFLAALAALFLALALPFGVVRGDDGPAGVTTVASDNYSLISVGDIADCRTKDGCVWRYDISVSPDGTATLLWQAVVRDKPFLDGLNRKSVKIIRVKTKASGKSEKDHYDLVAILPKSPNKKNDLWTMRESKCGAQMAPIKFLYDGKVWDTLPPDYQRRAVGNVTKLFPAADADPKSQAFADKFYWISAGDLVPDNNTILVSRGAPLYSEEFSDGWDRAALIRATKDELVVVTDTVTLGLDPSVKQSEIPDIFDRSKYIAVTVFLDGGRQSSYWPSRLQRWQVYDELGSMEWIKPGTVLYVSVRDIYVWLTPFGYWFNFKPGALASSQPFRDGFGESYEATMTKFEGGVFGMTRIPTPLWVFRARPDTLSASELYLTASSPR